MAKQAEQQRFIFKIHSERLKKSGWNLTLPIAEARRNDEVISLASSQVLRWIDELNGIENSDAIAVDIKRKIKEAKKDGCSVKNRHIIRSLYAELDSVQFKPDYMCLIIDKKKDYYRACDGFYINGIRYERLLGTNGGIKNSTIVFVSSRLAPELRRRIDNDRDINKPLVTAKLEAYKALSCSASIPVSLPDGVIVVDDCYTSFVSDTVYITDECEGEPMMEYRSDDAIEMDASDGFGIMMPSLAERWSGELGLDYVTSGVNTRFSFEKGMVFTFNFVEFAQEVAGGNFIIKDAWGDYKDVRNAELILTTSMVKLWDSYESCDDYISKTVRNGYSFGVAKCCPRELESERGLNYQFIQSYDLDDEDIKELTSGTEREISDSIGGDWRHALLFTKGCAMNENNVFRGDMDMYDAVMADARVADDPFVMSSLYQLIKNRINEAKVGVLNVHGNYSIVSGDPYALCQSMFGLEVTGLLKSGEIFNKYWIDAGAKNLACFRAPMTCHNNIRMVHPADRDECLRWYRYMNTCTIFNAWDTACSALNGMDYDGDLVMLTDNDVLVRKLGCLPALMCAQRKAEKKVSTDEDFIKSNIESFGNEIGQTTNWITSMFEVQSHFPKDSVEYDTLSYRIRCGQLYQQNAIDKAKGIICKPMPKTWHDRHAANKIEDCSEREFYRSIVADKKPYFMRYIYPALMKQYNTYIKNTNKNALREFMLTVDELYAIPADERTERQNEFLRYYEYRMPVGTGDCVMNKICRLFEDRFDSADGRYVKKSDFDYGILKSGANYTQSQYKAIKSLYDDFNKRLRNYSIYADYERIDKTSASAEMSVMCDEFRKDCTLVCPDESIMCDIMLDMCYSKASTKSFVWKVCGDTIVKNLLKKNGYNISYPEPDPCGDIEYAGRKFSVKTINVRNRYEHSA